MKPGAAAARPVLRLQGGRERSLLRRHPWVFSGAVDRVEGNPGVGETVAVKSRDGAFLGWAAYSPDSRIAARVWDFAEATVIDAEFFRARLRQAIALRTRVLPGEQALRLVHAESDGLPGLVVDRYGDALTLQASSAGAQHWRETIADLLLELTGASRIFERSDADSLGVEGLEARTGALRGPAENEAPFEEQGLRFRADLAHGHKTGFYLDQRDNRALLGSLCAGQEVLDCFSYVGAFATVALARGAARVTLVDSSAEALEAAGRHLADNGVEAGAERVQADVFQYLRRLRDQGRQFDIVVLDPPKFAPTAATAERAARGYKDINLLGFKLLRPGGLLFTFSCSGGVSPDLFQKIVAGAALDAGVDAQMLRRLGPGADHPVALNFPEGEYLKGLLCRRG